MAKRAPCVKNRKTSGRNVSNDSKTFKPGLGDEEKAARHRRAQSEYYARNPETRVRRREQAAQRRAAVKLLKRRWDPPRKTRQPECLSVGMTPSMCDSNHTSEVSAAMYTFKDPRAASEGVMADESRTFEHADASEPNAAVGTAGSPTSEEALASHALAQLAQGVASHVLQDTDLDQSVAHRRNEMSAGFEVNGNTIDDWRADSSGDTSILEKANQLSLESEGYPYLPAHTSRVPLAVRRGELPPGVAPLNRLQELALRITGDVGPLTVVQAAQIQVAELNWGDLSAATVTHEDAENWRVRRPLITDLWCHQDLTRKEIALNRWRVDVCKALRRARIEAAQGEADDSV